MFPNKFGQSVATFKHTISLSCPVFMKRDNQLILRQQKVGD